MPLSKPTEIPVKKIKSKPKTTAVVPVKKTTKPKAKPVVKTKAPVAKPITVAEVMEARETTSPPWLEDTSKPTQTPKVMGVSEFLKAVSMR